MIGFLFRRSRRLLEEMKRAAAFAAGYRTAQLYFGFGVPLVDWENEERRNAIKHGFTEAGRERNGELEKNTHHGSAQDR
jgi:hypothetical protein